MKSLIGYLLAVTAAIGLALASTAACGNGTASTLREPAPEQRPQLMVLGTGHFANPGRDLINVHVDDVLTGARQAQLDSVAKELASFHPTYIAVEWPPSHQDIIDEHYRAYRDGHYQLSRDEKEQIGFRLAAALGLSRVYGVDWNESPPGCDEKAFDWYEYAQTHGQQAQVAALMRKGSGIVPLGSRTIGQWLWELNRPDVLAANHRNYFDIAAVGDAQQQPGANWVGSWYARNLRIFNNIVQLTQKAQDRVLVVYGQGHAYLLQQFAKESGAFRVVNVDSVLRDQ